MENLKWSGEEKSRVGEIRNNLFQDGMEKRIDKRGMKK